jgi:hypothetical protein
MDSPKKVYSLFFTILGLFILPYIGGYIYYKGIFPPDFFAFPQLSAPPKIAYDPTIFYTLAVIELGIAVFILFPNWFGWTSIALPPKKEIKKVPLPIWFWVGLILWSVTLTFDSLIVDYPKFLLNWGAIPLFWGFTLMLDGWVYVRTGGHSMVAKKPQAVIAIGAAAISGWLQFEYFNFFVDESWYYPKGDLIPPAEFVVYSVIGTSGLFIPAIQWYHLLRTYDAFNYKYSAGPKLAFPKWLQWVILISAAVGMFVAPFFPDDLFFILWYSPLVILSIILTWLKIWTPFTPIKNGDWSYMVLLALSYLIQGFLFECWNYMSGKHMPDGSLISYSPDYWIYSIPYVSKYHIFEMPLLGFMGYLPFGVYCVVWWITVAKLFNIPTNFERDGY